MKKNVLELLQGWVPYSEKRKGQSVWFWVIDNVRLELIALGIREDIQNKVIQRLKQESLMRLKLRGNMLNLRKKHIPRIKEMYISVLQEFIQV